MDYQHDYYGRWPSRFERHRARGVKRRNATPAFDPQVELLRERVNRIRPTVAEAPYRQALVVLPPLHRPHGTAKMRGDFLPGIKASGIGSGAAVERGTRHLLGS